jgi:hypothetical protein
VRVADYKTCVRENSVDSASGRGGEQFMSRDISYLKRNAANCF